MKATRLPALALQLPLVHQWRHQWRSALAAAALVTGLVAALFYHWFALANRYDIFLYFHLEAVPFDVRTVSRYRMAGLVASGAVLVLYTAGCLIAGRLAVLTHKSFQPPSWALVWSLCSLPVALLNVFITTTQNNPTLPLPLAVSCAAVTLAGLAPALMPEQMAAAAPSRLLWVAATGLGVVPCLLLLRAVELPGIGLAVPSTAYLLAFGSTAAGVIWLLAVSWAASRWLLPPLRCGEVFVGAVCISYLLLPLVHHLYFTPPSHRYITVSDNFFAIHPAVQVACIAAAAGVSCLPSLFVSHHPLAKLDQE